MKSLLLLLLLLSSHVCQAQEWLRYSSVDSVYSVYLPILPVEQIDTIDQDSGVIIMRNLYAATKDSLLSDNDAYLVNVMHYPVMVDTVDVLQTLVEDIAQQLVGRLDYVSDDPDRGGLRARISLDHKAQVCRLVTFAKANSIYTLQVFTPLAHSLNDDTQYFFDSFTIY